MRQIINRHSERVKLLWIDSRHGSHSPGTLSDRHEKGRGDEEEGGEHTSREHWDVQLRVRLAERNEAKGKRERGSREEIASGP